MKPILSVAIIISLLISSCSKNSSSNTTAPSGWAATYNGNGATNTVQRVVINDAGPGKLQMLLQINSGGTYYTYVTIQSASIADSTATINENGLVSGSTNTYHFTGTAMLSGNNLVISGNGTNTANANDIRYYYFTGSR